MAGETGWQVLVSGTAKRERHGHSFRLQFGSRSETSLMTPMKRDQFLFGKIDGEPRAPVVELAAEVLTHRLQSKGGNGQSVTAASLQVHMQEINSSLSDQIDPYYAKNSMPHLNQT
eukprot:s575_g5.t1